MSYAGDLATTMLFFAFVFCVVGRIRRVLLCAGCVHAIHGAAGLATTEKAAGGGRKIGCYSFVHRRSFMYQHESKSGWWLDLTFGGSDPLRGSSSSGDVGFLEVLEAADPSLPVDCLPVRSAVIQHVDSDVLLKTAPKKSCSLPGRRSASSWELQLPAARTIRNAQGFECNFYFFQGCRYNLECNHQIL